MDGTTTARTTDKKMFIYFSGVPPGHKSVRKLLEEAIIEICELNFPKHLVNSIFPLMLEYLTLKVSLIANSESSLWFIYFLCNIMIYEWLINLNKYLTLQK